MAGSWRETVRDQIATKAAQSRKTSHTTTDQHIVRLGFGKKVLPYLLAACQLRGISIAGYIRRATMAHVAMDLEVEATELFDLDLAIRSLDVKGKRKNSKDLDGELYGRWEVQPDVHRKR